MKICHVITANPKKSIGGTPLVVSKLAGFFRADIIYGRGIGIFKTFIYPFFIPFLLYKKKFDVIHIHDTEGYGCVFFPGLMKKTVYTAHGLWDAYIEKMKPGGLAKLKLIIAAGMQRSLIKKSAHVIAVSEFVKNEIIRRYRLPDEKITVIYNGVDTKMFRPLKKGNTNTAIVVGDNPELKNLEKAVEYCRNRNMKLFVVGIEGKDDDLVIYLGKIPNKKMPEIYNMTDVLLFFSKVEGHPLVPLEAMACGIDVVASKESNIEIVPRQKDGSYMIKGSVGRKAVAKYDWKNQTAKYKKVYELVVANAKS
jgi:glycosyltransferase involved in cell wall biosynthesis